MSVVGTCQCPIDGCGEVCEVRQGKRRVTVHCPTHDVIMIQGRKGQEFLKKWVDAGAVSEKVPEVSEVVPEPAPEVEEPKKQGWRFFR